MNYSTKKSHTNCRLVYDSRQQLLTKTVFPFAELSKCQDQVCLKAEYQCREYKYCVPLEKICDGDYHCFLGDDEENCGRLKN